MNIGYIQKIQQLLREDGYVPYMLGVGEDYAYVSFAGHDGFVRRIAVRNYPNGVEVIAHNTGDELCLHGPVSLLYKAKPPEYFPVVRRNGRYDVGSAFYNGRNFNEILEAMISLIQQARPTR